MSVNVLYFASLREAAGCDSEVVETPESLPELYASLRKKRGFSLEAGRLRVAVDGIFVDWGSPVRDGAEIAFIPPVSGG
jgi:molybdopterin synthase sulfur carrier subunit